MKIAFWNTGRTADVSLIAGLCHDHRPDVIVLAEVESPISKLLRLLNSETRQQYIPDRSPGLSKRLQILTTLPPESVQLVHDTFDLAIRHYMPPVGAGLLLVAAHLRSKQYETASGQALSATRISQIVKQAELQVGHDRTVVIGDLNMNPFEDGLTAAAGMHALMDRRTTSRGSRVLNGERVPYFYNPMWSKFGDIGPEPPGTYFYNSSSQVNLYWHMFDQVLIRPSLAQVCGPEDVRIVTHIGGTSLLTAGLGRPKRYISDHLPIYVDIDGGRLQK